MRTDVSDGHSLNLFFFSFQECQLLEANASFEPCLFLTQILSLSVNGLQRGSLRDGQGVRSEGVDIKKKKKRNPLFHIKDEYLL